MCSPSVTGTCRDAHINQSVVLSLGGREALSKSGAWASQFACSDAYLRGVVFANWVAGGSYMENQELVTRKAEELSSMISPAQHAVLDYSVAATFFSVGFSWMSRHRAAATLALLNGGMVLGMSMLTKYPGGVFPKLSFKTHRTGDIIQAVFAGLGPVLFGFAGDAEAKYFYGQAVSEAGVIATTDWNAA